MRANTEGNIKLYDLVVTCRDFISLYKHTNRDWHDPFVQAHLIILKEKIKAVPTRIPEEDDLEGGA